MLPKHAKYLSFGRYPGAAKALAEATRLANGATRRGCMMELINKADKNAHFFHE
ncbi:MAG: hypothetical protein KAQ79_06930 [Cyclobacteriaceae bacterium]|nr:hypothetical protein [Cyclobacteriaceae bacterium]